MRKVRGLDGVLHLFENVLQISRDPFASLLEDGLRADMDIPLDRISSIDLEVPEASEVACVRFVLGTPLQGEEKLCCSDKRCNTVVFRKTDLAKFEEMKSTIESRMLLLNSDTVGGSGSPSRARD